MLDGIDVSTLVGLRDRAFLGVLVYSFARVSAAVSLRVADYYTQGPRSFFRLHEKGGRYNVVPAHHTAQGYVDAYLEATWIGEDRRGPLFRSCEPGRRDALQDRAMSRLSAFKMIKRRVRKAGLPAEICAHSFRGTGITEYLRNGGDLEVAARIAGHESTRTTRSTIGYRKRSRSTRSSASTSECLVATVLNRPRKRGNSTGGLSRVAQLRGSDPRIVPVTKTLVVGLPPKSLSSLLRNTQVPPHARGYRWPGTASQGRRKHLT